MPLLKVKTAQPRDDRQLNTPTPGSAVTVPPGAVVCGMRIVTTPEMIANPEFGANYGLEISRDNGPWRPFSEGGLPPGTTGAIGQAAGMDPGDIPTSTVDLYDYIEPEEGSSGVGPKTVVPGERVRVWVEAVGGNGGGAVRLGSVLFFQDINDQFVSF
jgi:hypothetical protein